MAGSGTLTVSDVQSTTEAWADLEPVDEDEDGEPDEPEPSETAVV